MMADLTLCEDQMFMGKQKNDRKHQNHKHGDSSYHNKPANKKKVHATTAYFREKISHARRHQTKPVYSAKKLVRIVDRFDIIKWDSSEYDTDYPNIGEIIDIAIDMDAPVDWEYVAEQTRIKNRRYIHPNDSDSEWS